MPNRFLKICFLLALTVMVVVGGILSWHFIGAKAENIKFPVAGWFYTSNYDWISLNSGNPELESYAGHDYNVEVEATAVSGVNELFGWGWSSKAGWVCFGKTCDPANVCGSFPISECAPSSFGTYLPGGESWQAKINYNTRKIEGWAKIISLKDRGLIDLGSGMALTGSQPGAACYDCKKVCKTWTPSGEDPEATTTPCLVFDEEKFSSCGSCFTRVKYDGANIPDATVTSTVGGSGNICLNCSTGCKKNLLANSLISCDSCSDCYYYGGATDNSNGALLGWAWNGNNDGTGTIANDGAGWIQLNPQRGESGIVYPWLQTQYGAVFDSKNFRQRSVVSGNNATYCIFAQEVFNFKSQNCAQSNIADVKISFPQKDNDDESYKNALGRLDVKGLTTTVRTVSSGGNSQEYNKYGNIIIRGVNQTWSGSVDLKNQVYVITGDLVVGGELTINNGSGANRGNGLVIVNGDLRIMNNINFQSGVAADLSQLASVAWVVKGDIRIENNVKNISGAFIALGKDNETCTVNPASTPDYPRYNLTGCGVFASGSSANPLVVSGMIMAKAFNFERTYTNIQQGSEKIIYDGRLIANPPPGMKSLLEALPIIRDFEF